MKTEAGEKRDKEQGKKKEEKIPSKNFFAV